MPTDPDDLIQSLKQPEYTGENRCTPCTIVNVCIAAVAAGAAATRGSKRTGRLLGTAVFTVSVALIYLRGYLVPGTPTLTKRYFPDWVLAWFDKEPETGTGEFVPADDVGGAAAESTSSPAGGADSSQGQSEDAADATDADETPDEQFQEAVDPEELLLDFGVVQPCEDVDDLCLTDEFVDDWQAATDDLEGDEVDVEVVADLFDADPDAISVDGPDEAPIVEAEGVGRQQWMSEGALQADASANAVLAAEHDRWTELPIQNRLSILKALRSFLQSCPVCGGSIEMGDEEVESCCRSFTVVAVSCTECDERFLEIDAGALEHDPEAAAP